MRKYTLRDLERELCGIKIGKKLLSRELVRSLGAHNALHWYYHTHISEFGNRSPHAYVQADGKRGKERLIREIYFLLTGQPD